ncbi:hypothetical protein BGW80DRAFT_1253500 [Lactifluus volemus]|nr:hypothetical protein BGW80DRAFT_1253500 [Lactifluus volemus]
MWSGYRIGTGSEGRTQRSVKGNERTERMCDRYGTVGGNRRHYLQEGTKGANPGPRFASEPYTGSCGFEKVGHSLSSMGCTQEDGEGQITINWHENLVTCLGMEWERDNVFDGLEGNSADRIYEIILRRHGPIRRHPRADDRQREGALSILIGTEISRWAWTYKLRGVIVTKRPDDYPHNHRSYGSDSTICRIRISPFCLGPNPIPMTQFTRGAGDSFRAAIY